MSEDNKECLMCHGVVKEPFVRCRQCYPTVDICLEVCLCCTFECYEGLFFRLREVQSWTKVLGQIYICGVFSHVPNEQPGANSFTYVQPLPSLPPSTMLDTCTRYFSRGSTLYVGGGGEGESNAL